MYAIIRNENSSEILLCLYITFCTVIQLGIVKQTVSMNKINYALIRNIFIDISIVYAQTFNEKYCFY